MTSAILRDRPRLRLGAPTPYPLVTAAVRAEHPTLADDFAVLDAELVPHFDELDTSALRAQNSFRLGQLFLLVGGTTATSLGAVQAALGGGQIVVGAAEALVAAVLTVTAGYIRARNAQREYFDTRLEAERLRGEYFLFLGRLAPYDVEDAEERRELLREQIAVIRSGTTTT
jgi:hypothetical protein